MRLWNDTARDADLFAAETLDAKCEKADLEQVAKQQNHLMEKQQSELLALLRKHAQLFDNQLQKYPFAKVHLELEPGATPVHKRHCPVPRIHQPTFEKELDRLVSISVLEPSGPSEWVAPTFIAPKKDGTACWICDFCASNKVFKRKQHPLPKILDVMSRRTRHAFFSKLRRCEHGTPRI